MKVRWKWLWIPVVVVLGAVAIDQMASLLPADSRVHVSGDRGWLLIPIAIWALYLLGTGWNRKYSDPPILTAEQVAARDEKMFKLGVVFRVLSGFAVRIALMAIAALSLLYFIIRFAKWAWSD